MASESNSAAQSEDDLFPARPLVRVPLPPEILAVEDAVLDTGDDGRPRPRRPRLGLAFSGGGIRSACFNLGLLQAVAERGHKDATLLKRADYLSTVSGGGYIGSWLVSCLRENDKFRPQDETSELDHLRKFARYLSPQGGFFSADGWTLATIWLRNTVLLQVMLCCFLGSLLMLPRLWRLAFQAGWETVTLWGAIGFFAVAVVAIFVELTRMLAVGGNVHRQGFVQWLIVIPLLAAAGLFAAHAWNHRDNTSHLMWVSGCVAFGSFAAAFLSLERRLMDRPLFPIAGSILIGAACGGLFGGLLHVILSLFDGWKIPISSIRASDCQGCDLDGVWKAAIWGGPLLLVALTAVVILLIGLAGRAMPDGTREWWSRLGAWLGIYSAAAMAVGFAGVFGPLYLFKLKVWAASGLTVGFLGTLVGMFFGKAGSTGKEGNSGLKEYVATAAPYLFIVVLIVGLSVLIHVGLIADKCVPCGELQNLKSTVCVRGCEGGKPVTIFTIMKNLTLSAESPWPTADQLVDFHWAILEFEEGGARQAWLWGTFAGLWALTLLFAWRVDLNEFSMNHFYRNRLVRCFMGAARAKVRKPNRFTLFDDHDDYPLCDLRADHAEQPYHGPIPIINTALNITGVNAKTGEADATIEERRAKSFSITPYFAGSGEKFDGYVEAQHFGDRAEGFRLGAAIATSGAAASPNMGYHTSAPIAFLLTFFNVRLGWWVANPRKARKRVEKWQKRHPAKGGATGRLPATNRLGLFYLLEELTGTADDTDAYVYLSDGGHFENLGVYELLRRRCAVIIVGDAEQDEDYVFEALGGLVRKAWRDLGANVKIDPTKIKRAKDREFSDEQYAIGTVTYCGDQEPKQGTILYIKSSLSGHEPADVLQYYYQHTAAGFPHETTADQFFDESQFEAYRKLGHLIATNALQSAAVSELLQRL